MDFDKMIRFADGTFHNPFVESWQELEKRGMVSRLVGLGFGSPSVLNSKTIWELKALLVERGLLRR